VTAAALRARWGEAGRRAGTHALLLWPVLALARVIQVGIANHAVAYDFSHS